MPESLTPALSRGERETSQPSRSRNMLAGIADFTGKIARTETPLSRRERGWG